MSKKFFNMLLSSTEADIKGLIAQISASTCVDKDKYIEKLNSLVRALSTLEDKCVLEVAREDEHIFSSYLEVKKAFYTSL